MKKLLITAMVLAALSACEAPNITSGNAASMCNTYESFGILPSRKIMEATGITVAPAWVKYINADGTVELECFPGPGNCKRVCRQSIPEWTRNPYNGAIVWHTKLATRDTIWFPYYDNYFGQ